MIALLLQSFEMPTIPGVVKKYLSCLEGGYYHFRSCITFLADDDSSQIPCDNICGARGNIWTMDLCLISLVNSIL